MSDERQGRAMDSEMVQIRVGLTVATDPPTSLERTVGVARARWEEMGEAQQRKFLADTASALVDSHVNSWAHVNGTGRAD